MDDVLAGADEIKRVFSVEDVTALLFSLCRGEPPGADVAEWLAQLPHATEADSALSPAALVGRMLDFGVPLSCRDEKVSVLLQQRRAGAAAALPCDGGLPRVRGGDGC
jgi:hypothetical protein